MSTPPPNQFCIRGSMFSIMPARFMSLNGDWLGTPVHVGQDIPRTFPEPDVSFRRVHHNVRASGFLVGGKRRSLRRDVH